MARQEVVVNVRQQARAQTGAQKNSRIGFWGTVTKVLPELHAVDVRCDLGFVLAGVPVMSGEWVTVKREAPELTGERDLPPVDSYVFCLMPSGEYTDCFVLCSGFAPAGAHGYFKGEGESYSNTRERITAGQWTFHEDKESGDARVSNPQVGGGLELEAKGDQVQVKAFNNTVLLTEEGRSDSTRGVFRRSVEGESFLEVNGTASVDASAGVSLAIFEGDARAAIETGSASLAITKGDAGVVLTEGGLEVLLEKGDLKLGLTEGSAEVALEKGDLKLGLTEGGLEIGLEKGELKASVGGGGITLESEKAIAVDGKDKIAIKSGADLSIEATGKLMIKNSAGGLGALIKELIGEVKGLQTMGGSTAQATSPASIAKLAILEAKVDMLLGA